MSASDKHWQAFETMLAAFMEAAWEAGGLDWNATRARDLRVMVEHLKTAVNEDIEDRLAIHADNAPHLYHDGSSA